MPPPKKKPNWMIIEAIEAKKLAIVMITTSRLTMWVSSWAMTPSSSAGESSSMMPVVAQTVAFFCERPIANALGIGGLGDRDPRLGQVGLHAQALDHRVQLGRLGGGDLAARPSRAARACREAKNCTDEQHRRRRATIVTALAPAANSTPMKTT